MHREAGQKLQDSFNKEGSEEDLGQQKEPWFGVEEKEEGRETRGTGRQTAEGGRDRGERYSSCPVCM